MFVPPPVSLMCRSLSPRPSSFPIPFLALSWWLPCRILRLGWTMNCCCALSVPSVFLLNRTSSFFLLFLVVFLCPLDALLRLCRRLPFLYFYLDGLSHELVGCQYARAFYLALQFGLCFFLSQRPSARVSRSSCLVPVHDHRWTDRIALTSFHFGRGGRGRENTIPFQSIYIFYCTNCIYFINCIVLYVVIVFTGSSFMRTMADE